MRRLTPLPRNTAGNMRRATTLRISASLQVAYANEWDKLVREMHPEIVETAKAEWRNSVGTGVGMDAKESAWERLLRRFSERVATVAPGMTNGMMKRLERTSEQNLEQSLREVAEGVKLVNSNPAAVQATIDAKLAENVYYIKRIPVEYIEGVRERVTEAINNGKGLEDIEKIMVERYGEARRHAKNVALDQTRKAYTAINTERMRSAGITKFEWVHTGGSQEPREYHLRSAAAGGLNGGIFDINDPPVIDLKTGERGLPGDDYFCRCTMRPIVTFDFGDEE